MQSDNQKLTIVETFVGCGGSHLGFLKAGYETLFINDINQEMINTILLNHKDIQETQYYVGSIENVNKDMIFEKQPIKDLDVLCGGVVCKGFSLAGVRNPSDVRNYLYKEQLRLVKELNPKVSVIENVPQFKTTHILRETKENQESIVRLRELYDRKRSNNGMKTNQRNDMASLDDEFKTLCSSIKELENKLKTSRYSVFEDIKEIYNELGYRAYDNILTCADYGDYTCRKRFFIVAVRNDILAECGEFEYPKPTHHKTGENGLPQWKTVNECLKQIDYSNTDDRDNHPMKHNAKTVKRFSYIPAGGSLVDAKDMPEELKTKKVFSSRGSSKRLHGDKSCPTLVPGHSAFPVHPIEHRSITIREGASLTGFPVDYKFSGSHTKRCEQIGNAIPVNVAYSIALCIKNYLNKE